ncbi:PR domain zinc finger protein 15-like [Microplitis demolitor]|uniref:PR domain zinc finger protein 15-like n=1 Tax=Microplitis demolitor TaxID=69319 RepID=UPI0004CD082C|nr:PR domain zinc finger protein 15-like [Microplitis demolitor]
MLSIKQKSEDDNKLIGCDVGNNNITINFSGCNICGDSHSTHECYFLLNLNYIKDTETISRARQTLPKDLEITRMADGTTSIIAKCDYQRGTTFGPFESKRNWAMNPATNFPIKVFGESVNDTYYLEYSDEDISNWMCFVLPATNAREQNLICYQMKQDIFYTAMRTITAGEELRVWYAPYYAQKMKMPLYITDSTSQDKPIQMVVAKDQDPLEVLDKAMAQELAKRLPATQLGAKDDKKIWTCRICSVTINSVVAYAKHQMDHYKPLVGSFCTVCDKKFSSVSALEKHRADCHDSAVSEDIGIPTSANQQQQNAATILNMSEDFMTGKENQHDLSLLDNSINTNDLLHHEGNLIENSSLKSILENQCLNMNISSIAESILSENISGADSVKFNVEELSSELLDISPDVDQRTTGRSIDDFDCDICGKKFQRVNYLYRHLRKHTGEFICPTCLCVFARKDNLLSHVCSAHTTQNKNNVRYQCSYCPKNFAVEKYLKRHIAQHVEFNRCKRCRHKFTTKSELDSHKCAAPKPVCGQCGKKFLNVVYLNRHIKRHNEVPKVPKKRIKNVEEKPAICEKCGEIFKNLCSLQQHQRSHGERTYECDICNRRFHRIGVLKEHKATHQNVELPCNICDKKLKSKKALDVHILLHGNKKFQCDKCDKSFFQKCNYLKHYKHVHAEKSTHTCSHCSMQFTNKITYNKHIASHSKTTAEFLCNTCNKYFHTQAKLNRHVQTCHSGIIYRCPFCKMTARHRHSMRRHFERQHKDSNDEWNKPGFVNQFAEKSPVEFIKNNSKKPGTSNKRVLHSKQPSVGSNAEPVIGPIAGSITGPIAGSITEPIVGTSTGPITGSVNESITGSVNGPITGSVTGPITGSVTGAITGSVVESFPVNLNTVQVNQVEENNQVLMENIKVDQQINNTQLLNDVPQLSIDTDSQLAESVLNNTYIFGEDGDIMFYVLDNNPIPGY